MTLEQYLLTPETVLPRELVFGQLYAVDAPSANHQRLVRQLCLELHDHLTAYRAGEVWLAPLDVILDADAPLVVQPDLCVICPDGVAVVNDKVHGAPDLVIEVLSPHPRVGDLTERLVWFATYGVRECWLVHQFEHWVSVIGFETGRQVRRKTFRELDRIESVVLPAFDANLSQIRRR
jgi:Uma2 family endonuclease